MIYEVETTARFDREFTKLDRYTQRMIKAWIEKKSSWLFRPQETRKGDDS